MRTCRSQGPPLAFPPQLKPPALPHPPHPHSPPRQVRLEHMLQRLRVLQQATLTGRPCRLMPRLYLSGAVEASSHHLLRHLGITHILNATEVRPCSLGRGRQVEVRAEGHTDTCKMIGARLQVALPRRGSTRLWRLVG